MNPDNYLLNDQKERVRLDGAYAAFEQLNRDGKFVLIFDGFDEMARQVSYQTTVNNFDELAKAAEGNAKVLLTCRKHYFREAREERSVLSGEASARVALERGDASKSEPGIVLRPGFEIVYLDEFTPADITTLLQRRFPAQWQEYNARLDATYNLSDLAKRPVLLDMIVQTLGEWGVGQIANAAQLYQVCTERWMERDIETGRAFMNQDDKRFFSEELATEVFRTGQLPGIHYSQFPAIIKKHFSRLERVEEIDHFAQDIFTHAFLIRDDDGKYRFAHNSFMEFFAAQKLWRGLRAGAGGEIQINEEIRAFICGLFAGNLPTSAAPLNVPSGMVYVPPGPFVMGGEMFDNEKPIHVATLLKGFFIDQFPVTQKQYKEFVDATQHRVPNVDAERAKPYNWDPKTRTFPPGLENHPVVLVSWDDANAYAQWAGKRLPTEMEWEKAARGIDGRVYPWGDVWDRHKANTASWWIDDDIITYDDWEKKFKLRWEDDWLGKKVMTTPVGQFQNDASPYGCGDLIGNVWEWCTDWYDENYYKSSPARNPRGPDSGQYRVLRGGSWYFEQGHSRAAYRDGGFATYSENFTGFRCAE
ncbi:MAG: SUMF1/EgtB/PvdO family nonheme iron enzyme [Chloroflexi bacterium]|nr:SUMF1/EgtB/PvdO family nonheme iron enzyme [Chloroflexota bacterium]